ncbi:MAG TPA: hypothetical protein DHV62_10735 [Elusimicrobia bacterium]|nr:hypothetical protein [Elusimicrobiota bacterium]
MKNIYGFIISNLAEKSKRFFCEIIYGFSAGGISGDGGTPIGNEGAEKCSSKACFAYNLN